MKEWRERGMGGWRDEGLGGGGRDGRRGGGAGAGRAVPGAGRRTRAGRVPPVAPPRCRRCCPPGSGAERSAAQPSPARRGARRGAPRMGREPRRQLPSRWESRGTGTGTGTGVAAAAGPVAGGYPCNRGGGSVLPGWPCEWGEVEGALHTWCPWRGGGGRAGGSL